MATASASPPKGRARWTLKLLVGEIVKLTENNSLSRETAGRRRADQTWRKDMWRIPQVDGEYVARTEHVVDSKSKRPIPSGRSYA